MIAWRRPTDLPLVEYGGTDQGFATMRVTSPYGDRPNPLYPQHSSRRTVFHGGLDIGNRRPGDLVVAAAAGRVIAEGALLEPWSMAAPAGAGWWGGNYGGLMAVVDHGSAVSIYAHLRRTVVSVGDRLDAGDPIGEVGDTGSAKGQPHLHFGIQVDGVDVDPWPLITAPTITREQRLAAEVLELRALHPRARRRWLRNTGLDERADGRPLTRETRLAAEVTYLREFQEA